jgi:hypothetical protein
MAETIQTPLTKLLGIKYPVLLAGMNGEAPSPTPNTLEYTHTHTHTHTHTNCAGESPRLMNSMGPVMAASWLRTKGHKKSAYV